MVQCEVYLRVYEEVLLLIFIHAFAACEELISISFYYLNTVLINTITLLGWFD